MCLPAVPMTEGVCFECGAELDYEDAYENRRGEAICGKCFDRKVNKAEATFENDR